MKKEIAIVDRDFDLAVTYKGLVNCTQDFAVVEICTTVEGAIECIEAKRPDIVFLEIDFPLSSGLKLMEVIKHKDFSIEIVVISRLTDRNSIFQSFRSGASGYLVKSQNTLEILDALKELKRNGSPLSSSVSRMIVRELQVNLDPIVSIREKEVLEHLAMGKNYREIAGDLKIAPDTTRTHIRNIYSKLEVNSKAEAIKRAKKEKIIL